MFFPRARPNLFIRTPHCGIAPLAGSRQRMRESTQRRSPVKRKFLVALTLLLVCTGAACWWYVSARAAVSEFPSDVLAMLPAESAVVVYADMASLRGEPLVQKLAAMAPAVQPNSDYAAFIKATGFEYE